MPLIIPSNSISAVGYEVDNSLRFNDGSSDYLSRTTSTPTSDKIGTYSFWFKRSHLGTTQNIFNNYIDASNYAFLRFDGSADRLEFFSLNGADDLSLRTARVFRDVSAWYHIVFRVDMTQSTSSNRLKFYVNGVEETSFTSTNYGVQNEVPSLFEASASGNNRIGTDETSTYHIDGYIAEAVYCDGQALDPTSFGEFDEDSSIWKPIDVSGLTFGTNGFYLDFENSGSLGNDKSGNGNNFTVNNLTSIDQTTDTPTNNFATWNPLDNYYGEGTTSEGNIRYTTGSTNQAPIPATIGVSSGKWYWEVKFVSDTGGYAMIGVASSQTTANNELGHNSTDYAYVSGTGQYRNNDGYTSYGNTYSTGDIIGVALDLDNNALYFSKNGTWQNSGDPESGASKTGAISITAPSSTNYGVYLPALSDFGSNTVVFDGNFGNPPFTISSGNSDGNGYGLFEYQPPSGYLALCTKNLATDG